MIKRIGWLILLPGAMTGGLNAQTVPGDAEFARRIAAFIAPFEARELSGTLLVARGGRIIVHQAYGLADYEHSARFTTATPTVVASLTKPFSIIIASALIDQNRMSLGDTVSRWLPEYVHGSRMTVGQLMSHMAGVPHRLLAEDQQSEPRTTAEMVLLANKLDLLFEPGARREYSSGGYTLLAAILERVSGASYDELLQRYVAQPVKARVIRHVSARDMLANRARSVMKAGDMVLNAPLRDLSFLVGAGSVSTTPADIFAVIRGLIGTAYTPTARTRLLSNEGLRWNGVTNGFRAFADYRTRDSLTVIFAGNAHTGVIDLLRREVPRLAAGEAVTPFSMPAHPRAELSEAVRKRLEGHYDTGGGNNARLSFISPSVALFGDRIMTAVNDSTLFSYADYALVSFQGGDAGTVTAIQWGPGTWGTGEAGPRFPRK